MEKRLLDEIDLGNELPRSKTHKQQTMTFDARDEAMRGFVHGLPETGKSSVIKWIIRMFKEAMKFTKALDLFLWPSKIV